MPIPLVTRILVADDFPVVRSGLKRLLDAQADLAVVAEAEDGAEAVEMDLREVTIRSAGTVQPGPRHIPSRAAIRSAIARVGR